MEQPSFDEGDNPPLSQPKDLGVVVRGVAGLGIDKNMGFVMFKACSKYGNAYLAFLKEYGFPYHLPSKILKEIIAIKACTVLKICIFEPIKNCFETK